MCLDDCHSHDVEDAPGIGVFCVGKLVVAAAFIVGRLNFSGDLSAMRSFKEDAIVPVCEHGTSNHGVGDLLFRKESKLPGRLVGKRTVLLEKSGGGEQEPVGRVVLGRNLPFDAICSNFMAKTECGPTLDLLFAVYLLDAAYSVGVNVAHIQQTTGIQNLRVFDYLNTHVALPPLPEQQRIVAYLDASCEEIDAAVAAKRRQLETLDALSKSTIKRAVTMGLDPSVRT